MRKLEVYLYPGENARALVRRWLTRSAWICREPTGVIIWAIKYSFVAVLSVLVWLMFNIQSIINLINPFLSNTLSSKYEYDWFSKLFFFTLCNDPINMTDLTLLLNHLGTDLPAFFSILSSFIVFCSKCNIILNYLSKLD